MRSFLILLFVAASVLSYGQSITWSAPVSIAANSFGNYHPRIALDRSGDPMVLWGASMKAAFSRWSGTSFTTPVYVTGSPMVFTASWAGPDIASFGDTVYVVVKRSPEVDSTMHMYLHRSFDGGQTFQTPVRIDYLGGDSISRFPAVTTDAIGNPVVAFMKFNGSFGDARYVVTRSMNFGASFMPDKKASAFNGATVCDCCPGAIVNSGNTTVMLYRNNAANIRTIWAGISTNNGNTYNGLELDNTNWMAMTCPSSGPDGAIIGDTLYTVFRSSAAGTRIYTSKSSLSSPLLISSDEYAPGLPAGSSRDYPRIANVGNTAAMVWKEVINGKSKACISFTNSLSSGFPVSYDTIANANVNNIDVVMRNGEVHVVWENTSTGTVMYQKGTYATPNSVVGLAEQVNIDVYPNPSKESITVPIADVAACEVLDVMGRKYEARMFSVNGRTTLSISHLAPGTYVLSLTDKQGAEYISKFTVER